MHSIIGSLIACAENSVSEADGMVTEAGISSSGDEHCYMLVDPDEITPKLLST